MELIVQPPNPLSYNADIKKNWKSWRKDFLSYLNVNCKDCSDEVKVSLLKQHIGKPGDQTVNNIIENIKNKNNLAVVLSKLDAHFDSLPENEVVARYDFFKTPRNIGSIDKYINYLKKKASTCNFGDIEDSIIRDKVILETNDDRLREKLFEKVNLDLNSLKDIYKKHISENQRKKESTSMIDKNTSNNIDTKNVKTASDNNTRKGQTIPKKNDNNNPGDASIDNSENNNKGTNSCGNTKQANNQQFKNNCWRCNQKHPIGNCPAWGSKCEECGKFHHYTSRCKFQNESRRTNISKSHCQQDNQQQPSAPPLLRTTETTLYPNLPPGVPTPINPGYSQHPQYLGMYNQNFHPMNATQPIPNMYNPSWTWMSNENTSHHQSIPSSASGPPETAATANISNTPKKIKSTSKSQNDCVLQ